MIPQNFLLVFSTVTHSRPSKLVGVTFLLSFFKYHKIKNLFSSLTKILEQEVKKIYFPLNQHQMLNLIPFLENLCKRIEKLLSFRQIKQTERKIIKKS